MVEIRIDLHKFHSQYHRQKKTILRGQTKAPALSCLRIYLFHVEKSSEILDSPLALYIFLPLLNLPMYQ